MSASVARRVGLVVNPTAGSARGRLSQADITRVLASRGHEVLDLSGATPGAALARSRTAVRAGEVDVLAVAGGDGMAHLGTNACAGTDVPLLVIPQGSGNDIARDWGVPLGDPRAATDLLDEGVVARVDAVRAGEREDRPWFAGVLYGGFDSLVGERANSWSWSLAGHKYELAVVRELPRFRPIPYTIAIDGHTLQTEAMLVTVANTASYGGGMRVCPGARHDDGLLDIMVLHEVNRVEFLRVFPRVFSGTHVDHPAVEMHRGRRVTLEADEVTVHADGEPFAPTPLTCEVVPGALRVLLPRDNR